MLDAAHQVSLQTHGQYGACRLQAVTKSPTGFKLLTHVNLMFFASQGDASASASAISAAFAARGANSDAAAKAIGSAYAQVCGWR